MSDRKLTAVPPASLRQAWPLVRDGFRNVEQYGDGWVAEDIYAACKQGTAWLFLCEDTVGNFDGAVVLIEQVGADDVKEILVWAAFSPNYGQPLNEWGALIDALATGAGARRISFYSPRRAWAKVAQAIGYRETQVKYTKELT